MDRAQALYLTVGVFTPEEREEHPDWVPAEMPLDQLKEIAASIKAGKAHVFDESRLNKLLAQHKAMSQVTPAHVFGALLRLFAPGLWLGAAVLVAWLLMRGSQ